MSPTRAQQLLGTTLFIGAVLLIAWGFIEAVQAEPAVAGTVGAALIPLGGAVWQQRKAEAVRAREAHRDRMSPVYYDLLGVMIEKFDGGGSGPLDPETENFFRDLRARQLTLGASSQMVKAFNNWVRFTTEAGQEGNDVAALVGWEMLIRAIREDLGHKDSDLPPHELLRLGFADFDKHFPSG
jgi:hypothetical protein